MVYKIFLETYIFSRESRSYSLFPQRVHKTYEFMSKQDVEEYLAILPPLNEKAPHHKFMKLFMDCVVHYSSLEFSDLPFLFLSSTPLSIPELIPPSQVHFLAINLTLNIRFT